jgi:hypothetical protein
LAVGCACWKAGGNTDKQGQGQGHDACFPKDFEHSRVSCQSLFFADIYLLNRNLQPQFDNNMGQPANVRRHKIQAARLFGVIAGLFADPGLDRQTA